MGRHRRRQLPARPAGALAGLAGARGPPPAGSGLAGRGRRWPWCARAGTLAGAGAAGRRTAPTARHGRRRPGQRARRRATTSSPTTAQVTDEPRARRRSTSAPTSTPGARRSPDFVRLAGELHRRRPVPRRRSSTPASRPRPTRSACRSWSGPWSTARGRPRAQPGHRLGPGTGARRPLHQVAPGARSASTSRWRSLSSAATSASSRWSRATCSAAPAPSRSRVGGHAGRPTRSASTSPTTTASTRQLRTGRRAARRADHQRDLHPHRPDRRSSSRSPGCARSRPAAGVVVASTNGVSGVIAPDGTRRRRGRRRATRAVLVDDVGLTYQRDPAPCGSARGSAAPPSALTVLVGRRCCVAARRIVGGARGPPGTSRSRRDAGVDRGERRRADLGRVVMVIPTYNEVENLAWIVGAAARGAARRRRAGRRRQLARRHRRDRRRARGRRPAGHTSLHRTEKAGLGAAYLARLRGRARRAATT